MASRAMPLLTVGLLTVALWPTATRAAAPTLDTRNDLAGRVGQLRRQLDDLVGDDTLLDALYFGWFDRPYARATLAIVVQTTALLERETRTRSSVPGASHDDALVADDRIIAKLDWAERALEAVKAPARFPGFHPDRFTLPKFPWNPGAAAGSLPPIFALADQFPSITSRSPFGNLDLLASMGQRIYVRLSGATNGDSVGDSTNGDSTIDDSLMHLLKSRSAALGMTVLRFDVPDGMEDRASPATTMVGEAATTLPVSLGQLVKLPPRADQANGISVLLIDQVSGESWPESLARRAAARGWHGSGQYGIWAWTAPRSIATDQPSPAETRAAMWLHAIEGQRMGVLTHWSDDPITFDPRRVEIITHTALDLIRLRAFIKPFQLHDRPPLAIAVGVEAVDPMDEHGWAAWIKPLWDRLLQRQIRFDIIGQGVAEQGSNGQGGTERIGEGYGIVHVLRKQTARNTRREVAGIERSLALEPDHQQRVTARDGDGRLADSVVVRDAVTPTGARCVALFNLSGRDRHVKLRGGQRLGALRDVIAEAIITDPNDRVDLNPWQVRLLWPISNRN